MTDIKSAEELFIKEKQVAPLRIIALNSAKELGDRINGYLTEWAKGTHYEEETFLVPAECPRFSSGDAKGLIKESIRGDDLYIIVDVGNYSCTYDLFGIENHMSPDDHYMDLKRIIQAVSGKAHRINVVMPILYGGRQHRRNYRESLDCAAALQELSAMGVSNIITFDAHDPRVHNAIPLMGFDNIMPSYQVLKTLFKAVPDIRADWDHLAVISPDEGAMSRNKLYASIMGVDLGMFHKQRDFSRLVNGRNPIIAHEYLGNDVAGKDVFIADDIISSGDSMLDIAYELKKRNANRIFTYATYALFVNGLEVFDKAVADGVLHGVFGTNLTYRRPELADRAWFHEVDVSKYAAYFIAALNCDVSVSTIVDPHAKMKQLLAEHRGE
ncbi:MAG: ribose-phosphate pyrophosphokinase [Ruminococcaceae bacterium]|nr:ribose-phosphate pyrophosphokinase [Oscillospiraceae bacterium]